MTTDEAIWQSAQNLLRSSKNLDKLWEAFDEIERREKKSVIEYVDAGSEDSGWIYPVWEAYYKVKQAPNGKLRDTGWITLAIQLTCDVGVEGDWQHGKRAKVLAGYAPFKSFDHAWGFDSEDPNSSGYVEECITDEYRWIHSDEVSWFFAVPLDALTSTDDVEKYIVTPMRRLVRGENPDEVLGAIRWRGKDWRSLSAIARAITGAHWSGPRFFGLAHEAAAKKQGKTAKRMAKVSSAARPPTAITQPLVQSSTARRGRVEA